MKLTTFQVFPTVNTDTTTCPELNVLISSVCFVCVAYCTFWRRKKIGNRVKKTNLMHNLFVFFVNLNMFQAYLGPSSGGTTVCIQQLVLIILFR